MHIDVNNAFLSWTAILLLRNGFSYDIRNINSVIGDEDSRRHGIVLSKSTPSKKHGVKTAEPIFMAKRKCPNLKVFKPNYKWYRYISDKMFSLIGSYVPDMEKMSIDECFIDYTSFRNLYGDPLKFAYRLKDEIKCKLGFTVNIGVANNKLCAKMASDFRKPDRVHTLFLDEVDRKMKVLPIEDLFFIGKKTALKLRDLNINTIGDLSITDPKRLYPYFKNQAFRMVEYANGIDDSLLDTNKTVSKGLSNSTTLPYNLIYKEDVYDVLYSISSNLAMQLRREKRYASGVRVLLKNSNFKSYSHQKKLKNCTNDEMVIYEVSKELVCDMWRDESIRLVGLGVFDLTEKQVYQVSIFDDEKFDNSLSDVLDDIKGKFGSDVIDRASMSFKKKVKKKY